jgi:hypothetical protein
MFCAPRHFSLARVPIFVTNVLVERSRHRDMNGVHSSFPTPMLAGNIAPTLTGLALCRLVFRRIDAKESRKIAMAVF